MSFGSWHPSCYPFVFGDGSVRCLSYSIDPVVLGEDLADEGEHVLPLVVGRYDHERAALYAAPPPSAGAISQTAAATASAWASVSSG